MAFQVLDFYHNVTEDGMRWIYLDWFDNESNQKWTFKNNEFMVQGGEQFSDLVLNAYRSITDEGTGVGMYPKQTLEVINQKWDIVYEEPHTCKTTLFKYSLRFYYFGEKTCQFY